MNKVFSSLLDFTPNNPYVKWPVDHKLPEFLKEYVIGGRCDLCYYTCNNQCTLAGLQRFLMSCKMVAPLMLPIHLIPFLMDIFKLSKKPNFSKEIYIRFKRRFSNWVQQTFSTSLLALIYMSGMCIYRLITKREMVPMIIGCTLPACYSAGITEVAGRRKELALYFFAKALRCFSNFTAKRGIYLSFRHCDIVGFMFAMGVMASLRKAKGSTLSSIAESVMGFLVGTN
mmetsp:Transcript_28300/g.32419  ORF Transcript_28300/g.32419 Transcript_28300/m.32419 type:complete len:228 (+) Transcript_28300:333-1016(+)